MPVAQAPKIVVDHNETDVFVVDPTFFTRPQSGYADTGIDDQVKEALKTYNPDEQMFFLYLTETNEGSTAEIEVCDRTELEPEVCDMFDNASVLVPKPGM